MVRVSLRELLAIGRFGPVQIGSRRDAVARRLGPPDDRDERAHADDTARIWRYGDIELHFDGPARDASLWLIHADSFVSVPRGGPRIELDPWIVSRALRLDDAEAELARAAIGSATRPSAVDPNLFEIRTAGGASLLFSGEHGEGRRGRVLVAVSLQQASRP